MTLPTLVWGRCSSSALSERLRASGRALVSVYTPSYYARRSVRADTGPGCHIPPGVHSMVPGTRKDREGEKKRKDKREGEDTLM